MDVFPRLRSAVGWLALGRAGILPGILALLACGCGGTPSLTSTAEPAEDSFEENSAENSRFAFCSHPSDSPEHRLLPEPELPEPTIDAGFVDIPAVTYGWQVVEGGDLQEVTSTSAKLFYSFVPADTEPKQAPLFLIFNGGPGGATTGMLQARGTNKRVIDPQTQRVEENPYSWTQMGNLLYVDARQAGFSTSSAAALSGSTLGPSEDGSWTVPEDSYNDHFDAADFVRVLLAVYAKHPALADNPVVLVGESYGGIRAQLILEALRDPDSLDSSDASPFRDPALAQAIRAHHAEVARRRAEAGLVELEPAAQFAWQVLIQPALVYGSLPRFTELRGTPVVAAIEQRARELGIEIDERVFRYQFDRTNEDALTMFRRTIETLLTREAFTELVGVDPAAIPFMSSTERQGTARFETPPDPAMSWELGCLSPSKSWLEALGELAPTDCYYVPLQGSITGGITESARRHSWQNGRLFLRNLRGVHTFVTRALLDLVVVADAIPWVVLAGYVPGSTHDNPLASLDDEDAITDVRLVTTAASGVARPGHIDVTYRNLTGSKSRRIRFPTYANAGHEVAAASPAELFEDVRQFLCAPATP